MSRKMFTRILAFVMTVAMVSASFTITAEAASKVKLSKKKVTLTITDTKKNPTVTLRVKGVSKKAKWSTSNKKVATVKKGKVTAKKAGKVTITCKVSGKKLKCKVTVKDKRLVDDPNLKVTVISTHASEKVEFHPSVGPDYPYNTEQAPGVAYNTQFVVTYNGKDVTKDAQICETSWENGIIKNPAFLAKLSKLKNPTITIQYKGKAKVVPVKVIQTRKPYYHCTGCNSHFLSKKELDEHQTAEMIAKDLWFLAYDKYSFLVYDIELR